MNKNRNPQTPRPIHWTLIDRLKDQGIKWFHWLLLFAYATALPTWFLDYSDMTRLDWIIKDLREYTLMPAVYFTCFFFIPYSHFTWKLFAWLSGWLAVWNLVNYLIWVNNPDAYDYLYPLFYPLLGLVVYIFLSNRAKENRIKGNHTTYNPHKTYIARKRPTSVKALAASIVYLWPVDTMSIIHEGKWYKMKGVFREVSMDYAKLKNYRLEEISPDGSFRYRLDFLLKKRRRFNLISWNCFHCSLFLSRGTD